MKTLLLILGFISGACAEIEIGYFGSIEEAGGPDFISINISINTSPAGVYYGRDPSGVFSYTLSAIVAGKQITRKLSKEEFIKCYHLASRGIREFRRPAPPTDERSFRQLWMAGASAEQVTLNFDVSAMKVNPALAELFATIEKLAKEKP